MSEVCHISSVLLTVRPDTIGRVTAAIGDLDSAEVALSDPSGKIIVTMQTPNEQCIVSNLNALAVMPGVVSAALVYHEIDDGSEADDHPDGSDNMEESDHGRLAS